MFAVHQRQQCREFLILSQPTESLSSWPWKGENPEPPGIYINVASDSAIKRHSGVSNYGCPLPPALACSPLGKTIWVHVKDRITIGIPDPARDWDGIRPSSSMSQAATGTALETFLFSPDTHYVTQKPRCWSCKGTKIQKYESMAADSSFTELKRHWRGSDKWFSTRELFIQWLTYNFTTALFKRADIKELNRYRSYEKGQETHPSALRCSHYKQQTVCGRQQDTRGLKLCELCRLWTWETQ